MPLLVTHNSLPEPERGLVEREVVSGLGTHRGSDSWRVKISPLLYLPGRFLVIVETADERQVGAWLFRSLDEPIRSRIHNDLAELREW